ncbi:MAG: peptidyl-prolyl cis-trans isomerase [Deltaproteobacteria bacterium]|nr:peptidyl-prolyl cis-trans isomerase [Deltaproteobacteria bacterium]
MSRFLGEPLVHFVVLGAALFALHRAVAPPAATNVIVVTTALQRGFQQEHARRHGRAPTAEEQRALVDRYVETEVMLREALALGLDRGDIIVRRRLVQKMEFLNQDREPLPAPTDADLAAFLARHAERYRLAGRTTVAHVFVSARLHPDDAETIAEELRARLAAGEDPASLGDPFLRGREFREATEGELGGVFGPELARRLQGAPVGVWVGPYRSSFGLHLVRIAERSGGRPATVDEVRRELGRDWEEERRRDVAGAALRALRARYDVRIDPPPAQEAPAS